MSLYYLKDGNGNVIEATTEHFLIKESFEQMYLSKLELTPEQWEIVAKDIDNTLDRFLDELQGKIAKLIESGLYFSGGNQGGENAER